MYFQTKLISSFVVSYLLLLSFLERKWTNFLISQGRFKDLSFGRPLRDLPSHHSYFRFLIFESGHISQLNLQANFFNLTSLIKQTFTRSTEDTTEPTFHQFYVAIALLIQLEFILTPFLHSNFLHEKSMDFYRSSSLRPLNESFFATKSLDRLSPTFIGC